eukprot:390192_1
MLTPGRIVCFSLAFSLGRITQSRASPDVLLDVWVPYFPNSPRKTVLAVAVEVHVQGILECTVLIQVFGIQSAYRDARIQTPFSTVFLARLARVSPVLFGAVIVPGTTSFSGKNFQTPVLSILSELCTDEKLLFLTFEAFNLIARSRNVRDVLLVTTKQFDSARSVIFSHRATSVLNDPRRSIHRRRDPLAIHSVNLSLATGASSTLPICVVLERRQSDTDGNSRLDYGIPSMARTVRRVERREREISLVRACRKRESPTLHPMT